MEAVNKNWNEGVEWINGLQPERNCWTLHDLHDHHNVTWEQISKSDAIEADIKTARHVIRVAIEAPSKEKFERWLRQKLPFR